MPDETGMPGAQRRDHAQAEDAAAGRPDERAERRASHQLPEELAVGSTDPAAQARAVLADSDAREHLLAPDSFLERRTSEQATEPLEDERAEDQT